MCEGFWPAAIAQHSQRNRPVYGANAVRDGYDEAALRIKNSLPDVAVISGIVIAMRNANSSLSEK